MEASPKTALTILDALQDAGRTLTGHGIDNPRLEAGLLLSHVMGVTREALLLYPDRELTDFQAAQFNRSVERRSRKEPVAYLTGRREFWSLQFEVNPNVLIPRPETEGVIEQLLSMAEDQNDDRELSILDVGTGSGILAITAAVEFPQSRVTAVDVSEEALAVARDNAHCHQVAERIEFFIWDMMGDEDMPGPGGFDFILSNPPYIPSGELAALMSDVRDYEPMQALDGGPDGLSFYRKIIPRAETCLKPGGGLIVEVGDGQAEAVVDLIKTQNGFEVITIHQDLSGTGRVVSARRGHG